MYILNRVPTKIGIKTLFELQKGWKASCDICTFGISVRIICGISFDIAENSKRYRFDYPPYSIRSCGIKNAKYAKFFENDLVGAINFRI